MNGKRKDQEKRVSREREREREKIEKERKKNIEKEDRRLYAHPIAIKYLVQYDIFILF